MIDVKRPVLLDAVLNPSRTVNASAMELAFNSPGVSQATLTLPPDEPELPMHAWVNLYNQNGFAGVFRVTTPQTDFLQAQTVTLRHGIDVLSDAVCAEQGDFSGTVTQLLTKILGYQTQGIGGTKFWALGTCEDSHTLKYSLNYDNLMDLMAKIEEDEPDYYFVYDQSSFPWTVSFVAKPAFADTEFRENRNIRSISRTYNDNDLCTRLILSINSKGTETINPKSVPTGSHGDYSDIDSDTASETLTVIKTYNNAAAQAVWGVITKTADIDTHDDLTSASWPEADAWAAKFLAQHAGPSAQIQLTGEEFTRLTGDSWDETKIGHICRVPLPGKNTSILERVVNITYPDALGDPTTVTISLATQLPKFSSGIASLKKESAATAASARASARTVSTAATEKDLKSWSMIVKEQQVAMDGTGITQLYETGIDMDAQGGATIYSINQGVQSLYGGIQVQAGRINLVVQGEGSSASIRIDAIVDGINGSQVTINANRILINGNTTLNGVFEINNSGYLWVKKSAIIGGDVSSSSTVEISGGTVSAYTQEVKSGGVLKINGSSGYSAEINFLKAGSLITDLQFDDTRSGGVIYLQKKTVYNQNWTDAANFNIAATQTYINGVAAVVVSSEGLWSNGSKTLTLSNGNTHDVRIPTSSATWSSYQPDNTHISVTCIVGGASITNTFNVSGGGGNNDDIRIAADERFDNKPNFGTEIFEDAGDYEDLRDKKTGYYTFRAGIGNAVNNPKWYYFHVGNS